MSGHDFHKGISKHAPLGGVVGLAAGIFHSIVLKQDGSVWSTGASSDARFVEVMSSRAMAVDAGTGYSIVLKKDGSVWTTDEPNAKSSFLNRSKTIRRTFSVVRIITDAKAVAAGTYHSIVLTQEGHVWASGWNKHGQLGDSLTSYTSRFFATISSGTKVLAVAAGDMHSIVLKEDGSVWAAGRNCNGQLGDGSKADRSSFVKVISGGAAGVTAGRDHSMLLKQDGSVWATGRNEYGQLGDGSTTDRISYVKVVSSGVKTVAAGSQHSMILKQDGSVWTTGHNGYGQLGHGSAVDNQVFVAAVSVGVKVVAAGAFHSMVVKEDGSIWATGSNKYGQFGDGSQTSECRFVRLAPFGDGT